MIYECVDENGKTITYAIPANVIHIEPPGDDDKIAVWLRELPQPVLCHSLRLISELDMIGNLTVKHGKK